MIKKNFFLLLLQLVLFINTATVFAQEQSLKALVLLNSSAVESKMAREYLIPYLEHFGILYETKEISELKTIKNLGAYPLIIISHDKISKNNSILDQTIVKKITNAMKSGSGVVSFDADLFTTRTVVDSIKVDTLHFSNTSHYITELHAGTPKLRLFSEMKLAKSGSALKSLIESNSFPVLSVSDEIGKRLVVWHTNAWMQTTVLGPLAGMDDCLWRSLVWAARKPFVMHALRPIVTMRVDDVAGCGTIWKQSPLNWIKIANNYNIKPWLGLFIYNLTPEAITELREYILSGQATASPHAFGRPSRDKSNNVIYSPNNTNDGFYYNPKAMALRETEYDEFIFFDHHLSQPIADNEAIKGLKAVDQWYSDNQPLPKSKYFVAHYYEMSSNIIEHVSTQWGMEFVAQNKALDNPWSDSVKWVKQGPFRRYEQPGTNTDNETLRGNRPIYYADFTNLAGYPFFNCITEIRDNAGYEWAPDNNNEASAGRGITQLRRALSSMCLGVLFTHETDFIYLIDPKNWDWQLKTITKAVSEFNPLYLTIDDALEIVRAMKTSKFNHASFSGKENKLSLNLTGNAKVKTSVYLYTEGKDGSIEQQILDIKPFSKELRTEFIIKQ